MRGAADKEEPPPPPPPLRRVAAAAPPLIFPLSSPSPFPPILLLHRHRPWSRRRPFWYRHRRPAAGSTAPIAGSAMPACHCGESAPTARPGAAPRRDSPPSPLPPTPAPAAAGGASLLAEKAAAAAAGEAGTTPAPALQRPPQPAALGEAKPADGGPDAIVLHVGGMSCGGCAAKVKRIVENQEHCACIFALLKANYVQQLGGSFVVG